MIKVDIAEIEKLTDVLVKTASDSDEAFNRLKQVLNEMNEDLELATYLQSGVAIEAASIARDSLNRGNDMLQSLRNIVFPIASTYKETEQKNKDALNRMITLMDNKMVGFNAAIVAENQVHMEHTEEIVSQNLVQKLVDESAEEMQATNIAAVTKTIKKEYSISEIRDMEE